MALAAVAALVAVVLSIPGIRAGKEENRVRAEIVADARSRESSRVKAARCERIPAGEPAPATDLAAAEVGLSCVAVTSELDANERTTGVTSGYPYRALVDFRTGRVGFCRTVSQPGEGSYRDLPEVSTPAVCGGG